MGKGTDFLKEAGVYFIATSENGQPQLRPFGSNMEYKGRFYFSMGRSKNVFRQIISNPKVSIAALKPDRDWIRIIGEAVLDETEDAKNYLLDNNPRIKEIYKDNPTEIAMFYLVNVTCTINESGKEPVQADL
ncbi:MAG: pyridoxamine 5'-phosphate oxidase family protein [Clostridiales bacterium]|nr:pyridoxamine 5'-phosphate oxidase family protein [Clostridiales bacterium]